MRAWQMLVLAGAAFVNARAMDGLSPAQVSELRAGRQVVITEEVAGHPWPKVTVYQLSPLPPEVLAAVFFDYDAARRYVPNVLKSRVRSWRSTCEADVDYTLQIPVLPDEEYVARNTLTRVAGGGYAIGWKLLSAKHTKASEGEFLVRPMGDGGSLARYRALTTPGAAIAGLLKAQAVAQMRDALAALCREARRLNEKAPGELAGKVERLRAALGPEATSG